MVSVKVLAAALVAVAVLAGFACLAASDGSSAKTVTLADVNLGTFSGTTRTPAASVDLWDFDSQDSRLACEAIKTWDDRGELSVDRSHCPSWVSYRIFDAAYRVVISVAFGGVCDSDYRLIFSGHGAQVIVRMHLVISQGFDEHGNPSNTPDDNLSDFILYFDTAGGGVLSPVRVSGPGASHRFDLSGYAPERAGFVFDGWRNFAGDAVASVVCPSGGSVTVYAQWKEGGLFIDGFGDFLYELLMNPMFILFFLVCLFGSAMIFRRRLSRFGGYRRCGLC